MKELQSGRFGRLTYDERDVILLPEGLVGLPALKRWILLDMERSLPLKWLQSLDDGDFGLPVTAPGYYAEDYDIRPPATALSVLRAGESVELVVLIITTVHAGGTKLTGNLAAPLLIEPRTRKGVQAILDDPRWALRQEIDYVRFGLDAASAAPPASGSPEAGAAEPLERERQEATL